MKLFVTVLKKCSWVPFNLAMVAAWRYGSCWWWSSDCISYESLVGDSTFDAVDKLLVADLSEMFRHLHAINIFCMRSLLAPYKICLKEMRLFNETLFSCSPITIFGPNNTHKFTLSLFQLVWTLYSVPNEIVWEMIFLFCILLSLDIQQTYLFHCSGISPLYIYRKKRLFCNLRRYCGCFQTMAEKR